MTGKKEKRSRGATIEAEIADSLDEELELELDDERPEQLLDGTAAGRQADLLDRQRERVKLQDWVVEQKQKVVIIFEGRDAAGKGGVIKRITQRLNPLV